MTSQGNIVSDVSIGNVSMNHVRSSSASLITEATSNLTKEDELSRVRIYTELCQYEETLAALVDSVDNFKPDIKIAHELIDVDKNLFKSLDSFAEYDKIDSELKRLETESNELDQRTKEILETLNDCYNKLNELPMLEQVEFEKQTILKQRSKINSHVLLDYATKLSKFTKIPPTFDKGSIGPNNFIWPAEDALRRGMLAMASLHAKEVTRIPGEADEEDGEHQEEQGHQKEEEEEKEDFIHDTQLQPQLERRPSYVFDDHAPKEDEDAMDLDLDLFNPDEF